MELALIIVMAIALLALIVFGLHKNQLLRVERNADRFSPLPPLDPESKDRLNLEDDEFHVDRGFLDLADDSRDLIDKSDQAPVEDPDIFRENSSMEIPEEPEPEIMTQSLRIWQEQISLLKKENSLQQALEVCQTEFPLLQAYVQASIIIRAMIRKKQTRQQDVESELQQLYNTAVVAELVQSKNAAAANLALGSIKTLKLNEIARLELPYSELGYENLRLLKKTDVKLLQQHWGEPGQHQNPADLSESNWNQTMTNPG